MKREYQKHLQHVVCLYSILVLIDLFKFNSQSFISLQNQTALLLGIDINSVYEYQGSKGLTNELALGDTNNEVRMVQHALTKVDPDFTSDNITGYFGGKTKIALTHFQKQLGLLETGKIDAATRDVVNAIYVKELCPDAEHADYLDDILIKVNKDIQLSEQYVPQNLIRLPNDIKSVRLTCLKDEIIPYVRDMFNDAQKTE